MEKSPPGMAYGVTAIRRPHRGTRLASFCPGRSEVEWSPLLTGVSSARCCAGTRQYRGALRAGPIERLTSYGRVARTRADRREGESLLPLATPRRDRPR